MSLLHRILGAIPLDGRADESTDADLDCAIRAAVRGEVAGAAPRFDSWQRLQGRIGQDANRPAVAFHHVRPLLLAPVGPATMVGLFTRFSQVGAALMLLLLIWADPSTFHRLGTPVAAFLTPVAQVSAPAYESASPRPLNRGQLGKIDQVLSAAADELAVVRPADAVRKNSGADDGAYAPEPLPRPVRRANDENRAVAPANSGLVPR